MHSRWNYFVWLAILTPFSPSDAQDSIDHARLAQEFVRVLPRGAIAAISEPDYVVAAEANIGDNSFVLGVIIDDQPFAYSLNLLNRHEVVNDIFGGSAFAAVW